MYKQNSISKFFFKFQNEFSSNLQQLTQKNLRDGKDHIKVFFMDGHYPFNSLSRELLITRYPNSEFGNQQTARILQIIREEVWNLGFEIDMEFETVTTWKFKNKFPFIEFIHHQRPKQAIIRFK